MHIIISLGGSLCSDYTHLYAMEKLYSFFVLLHDLFVRFNGTPCETVSQPPHESRLLHEANPTLVQNLKMTTFAYPSAPNATPVYTDMEVLTDFNRNYKT